jgi:hypothetical protein
VFALLPAFIQRAFIAFSRAAVVLSLWLLPAGSTFKPI